MHYHQLVNQIKQGQIMPMYLFYGQEIFLADKIVNLLKSTVLDPNMLDFNFELVDGETVSLESILVMANTLPVLATYRLLVVKNFSLLSSTGRQTKSGQDIAAVDTLLADYLSDPNPSTILVLVTSGNVDRRRRLFKLIKQKGVVLEFATLRGKALVSWVEQWVEAKGKKINPDALQYLISTTGITLTQLAQEIEKACLYVGKQRTIDLATMKAILPPAVEGGVFDVVDAVMAKRGTEAIKLVRQMLSTGEQPAKVFYLIVRQLCLIAQVKLPVSSSSNQSIRPKLAPFILRKCRQQAVNFSWPELVRAFKLCRQVDRSLKTSVGDEGLLLELLIVKLCQAA